MGNDAIAGKTEIIIEPHDIDAQSEQRLAISKSPEIPSQICNLITLVPQSSADLRRRLTHDFGYGHARMNRQTQRQNVRDHSGNGPCGAIAHRDRHAKHQVCFAAEAMQEDRSRRGYDPR